MKAIQGNNTYLATFQCTWIRWVILAFPDTLTQCKLESLIPDVLGTTSCSYWSTQDNTWLLRLAWKDTIWRYVWST